MNRLEAMVTLEQYGDAEPCSKCGHGFPSLACTAPSCPILEMLQAQDPEDDVRAIAAEILRSK